jgi:S1-C subfamily serine protease
MMNFDVFISYPHESKAAADAACASLEAAGVRCWIAPRDVDPGSEWAGAVIDAIDRCRIMVVIFSSETNKSKQIRREVQRAFDKGIPIIPLRIHDVLPEKSLAYIMGPVHWLDALTPPIEQHLERLTKSVRVMLDGDVGGAIDTTHRPAASPEIVEEAEKSPFKSAEKRDVSVLRRSAIAWTAATVVAAGLGGGIWTFVRNRFASPLSPSEIFDRYAKSTVFITARWRLNDRQTGKQVYQKVVTTSDGSFPAFKKNGSGEISRWLTIEDGGGKNIPIGGADQSGVGFAVSDNGLILTCKHLVAPWLVPYGDLGESHGYTKGAVFADGSKSMELTELNDSSLLGSREWIPATGGSIYTDDGMVLHGSVGDTDTFTAKDDVLDVRLPGIHTSIRADLTRTSATSDLALLKIEGAPQAVELAHQNAVRAGDKVTAIVFPGGMPEFSVSQSSGLNLIERRAEFVPQPAPVEGVVVRPGGNATHGLIQLNMSNGLGPHSSGSPVFNDDGKVIGLLDYVLMYQNGAKYYYAVPANDASDLVRQ